MNIGLIDVDSHNFPNLVLMKLSAWHKTKGDNVFLLKPDDVLKGGNLFCEYDKMIGACVFTENKDIADKLEDCGVHIAGTGTGKSETLPDEIEHIMPDYSLYGITDTAYGFMSRGCPRGCPFCIVAGKEGKQSRKAADLSEFWNGQKEIKLLDPNLLACEQSIDLLRQLQESGAWVDFTQGLDVRLMTDEVQEIICNLKIKMIHFAWDSPKDKKTKDMLARFRKNISLDFRRLRVYVLTNFWSSHEEDLSRVYWLRANGYDPYIMVYDKKNAPKQTRRLQRWVNNKFIFRSCERFEDYEA